MDREVTFEAGVGIIMESNFTFFALSKPAEDKAESARRIAESRASVDRVTDLKNSVSRDIFKAMDAEAAARVLGILTDLEEFEA